MKGKRLCRRVAAKRDPMSVSDLSSAELWGVVLGDSTAGKHAAAALAELTPAQLADEGALARELQKWPKLYEGRAGMILAVLALGGRVMRELRGRQLQAAA